MKDNHKYRVSVYLGKDLYEKIGKLAGYMGIPVATATKILLSTGFELANSMEGAINTSLKAISTNPTPKNQEKGEARTNGIEQSKV